MGGNAFDNVSSITLEQLRVEYHLICKYLEGLGFYDITPVGSTFKKDVMGDIDIAARFNASRDDAYDVLRERLKEQYVRRIGSNIVSFVWPLADSFVQVDLVIGDVEFIKWARFGPPVSRFKGTMRQIFLSAILNAMSERDFGDRWNGEYKRKYTLDIDNGFFTVLKTKKGVRGGTLQKWKTLERELISRSPSEIVKMIFGKYTIPEDVLSFESAVTQFKHSYLLESIADRIIEIFVGDVDDIANRQPLRIAKTRPEAIASAEAAKCLLRDIAC